jgi:hypothetical protein
VTALLVAAGAEVVAIDPLPAMLEGARRRAPSATIIEGDLFDVEIPGHFDRVVLSFVLHNFDTNGRMEVLRLSERALASGGQVGVLDWAVPSGRIRASLWRRFLTRLEPSSAPVEVTDADLERKYLGGEAPNVSAVLDGALPIDIRAAGLDVRSSPGRRQRSRPDHDRSSTGRRHPRVIRGRSLVTVTAVTPTRACCHRECSDA